MILSSSYGTLEQLRQWIGRSAQAGRRVGVHFSGDEVAIAAFATEGGARLELADTCSIGQGGVVAALGELVTRHGLRGAPATLVLGGQEYESQQLEIPGVPDEELPGAARLRVRDLTQLPLERACVAVQRLHTDRKPGGGAMVSVAVAEKAGVARQVTEVDQAGLRVDEVLPREFALGRLAEWLPDPERGVAFLLIGQRDGLISVSRGGRLYLNRPHYHGVQQLAGANEREVQGLLLELQRSLDYYESQLASAEASQVLVLPTRADRDVILDTFSEGLTVPAARLDIAHVLDGSGVDALDGDLQARALLAIAGAASAGGGRAVSFYDPPDRRIDPLGAGAIAGYVGGSLLIAALAASVQSARVSGLEDEVTALEREQRGAEEQVAELQSALDAREPDEALVQRHDQLKDQIAMRERFADELDTLEGPHEAGFSELLSAFSRQQLEGVWLTGFRIDGDELELHGRATRASLLAEQLERLADETALQGVAFQGVRVRAVTDNDTGATALPEQGGVVFRLSTEAQE